MEPSDHLAPQELHDYYGITASASFRRDGETGAGHDDSDEEDDDVSQERKRALKIGAGQERQVRHAPVEVVKSRCPFHTDNELELFVSALDLIKQQGVVPAGFGLEDPYSSIEKFHTGRSRKGISVALPYKVWYPRVLLWCQALDILKRFPMIVRGE